jgi:hypothetical protein
VVSRRKSYSLVHSGDCLFYGAAQTTPANADDLERFQSKGRHVVNIMSQVRGAQDLGFFRITVDLYG